MGQTIATQAVFRFRDYVFNGFFGEIQRSGTIGKTVAVRNQLDGAAFDRLKIGLRGNSP